MQYNSISLTEGLLDTLSGLADRQFGSCYKWRPRVLRELSAGLLRAKFPLKEVQIRTNPPTPNLGQITVPVELVQYNCRSINKPKNH